MRLGEIPEGLEGEIAWCTREDEGMGILQTEGSADQADKIYHYMKGEGFELRQTGIAGNDNWDDVFDNNEIDVLIVGNHPGGIDASVGFARRVIQRNPLIDVLAYGSKEIEPRTVYDRSVYTAIWTHSGTDYADRAISLIGAYRQKWNDTIFLRGMVISQIVDVEAHINDALAAHFFPLSPAPLGRQFEEYMLENPMYLLEGKKQTLKNILEESGLGDMWKGMNRTISELQNKRNKLAHCEVDPDDPGSVTSMGKTYRYDRKSMRGILKNARLARQRLLDIIDAIRARS